MGTLMNLGILFLLDITARVIVGIRRAMGVAAPILLLSTCCLLGSAARAQNVGYMRVLSSGGQLAGESTDPRYPGWILVRQATLPSGAEIASMATETSAGASSDSSKAVHRPVVVVKFRDDTSLAMLAAYTGHQHFPEVDIVMAPERAPPIHYKLTDATIISVRASGADGTQEPLEQLRINYAKIEIVQ